MAPAALALATSSALAGQITLYEGGEFQGRAMPTSSDLSVVAASSSAIVNDGTWEVCTSAYYRGQCAQLPPGKYARIDATLRAPVVSARQVTSEPVAAVRIAPSTVTVAPATAVANPQVVAGNGRIVLYEYPNFSGVSVAIERGQARDLDWANFANPNHRATSIRVEAGTWRVCSGLDFAGECRILGPGEYPLLPGALFTGIASAQQVFRPEYGALNVYTR